MVSPVHTVNARDLKRDDRILLKDLRVLVVTRVAHGSPTVFDYRNDAARDTGRMETDPLQKLKVLCEGWCPIEEELADLL